MFLPKIYQSQDENLMKQIISENAFATLISNKNNKISASRAMFLWNDNEAFFLETHLSRANPQAKIVENGDQVLCDFLGAHSYISSSWYEKTNVSTWNYEAVQIYGAIKLMNDDELYQHLENLTLKFENNQKCPMTVEKMGKDYVEKEMRGAFGIKIYPTEIYIKQKLSQNRNEQDFKNIILNLEDSTDLNSNAIAKKMKDL